MAGSFVRISSLIWADILVVYALFVMQNYLSDVWGLSFTHAAGILNIWGGITKILPLFFLFFVDAFLGNLRMLVISSISYTLVNRGVFAFYVGGIIVTFPAKYVIRLGKVFMGIGFIAMSTPPILANSTGTCKEYEPQCIGHTQRVLLYTGMALVAIGISGNLISLHPFLDENNSKNQNASESPWQIAGYILVVLVAVVGAIALPYIKPWSLRFGIPAICTAFATIVFCSGGCYYVESDPKGSPLTKVCRVFTAFAFNICKPLPLDAMLYKKDGDESFKRTRLLRCLEKAAIITNPEDTERNKWKLCSVQEVEEAKIAVRMVPMWTTFIICGIVSSIGNTYFLEQANNMNRKIGKWEVPLPILLLLFKVAKEGFNTLSQIILPVSEKRAAELAKKSKEHAPIRAKKFLWISKEHAPSIGIAVAMIFSILCCITAAKLETRRLNVIRSHDLLDNPDEDIPMSIYWLLFQFFLLAGLDSYFEKSVVAFYDVQAPESMTNYLEYFTEAVTGLGFMCSVLLVYVVGKISEMGGRQNWFQYTLNRSRLDRYYWVLAGLSCVNLLVFILVAFSYRYKNIEAKEEVESERGDSDGLSSDIAQACCSCF